MPALPCLPPAAARALLVRHAQLLVYLASLGVSVPPPLPILLGPQADPVLAPWWHALLASLTARQFARRWREGPRRGWAAGLLRLAPQMTPDAWRAAWEDVLERVPATHRRTAQHVLQQAALTARLPASHRGIGEPLTGVPFTDNGRSATLGP